MTYARKTRWTSQAKSKHRRSRAAKGQALSMTGPEKI
jgi:hypothetical protein